MVLRVLRGRQSPGPLGERVVYHVIIHFSRKFYIFLRNYLLLVETFLLRVMIPVEELRKDPDWSKWVGVQEVSVMDSGNGVLLSSTSFQHLVAYLDGIWSIVVGFVIILSVVTTTANSFIVYPIVSESVPIPVFFYSHSGIERWTRILCACLLASFPCGGGCSRKLDYVLFDHRNRFRRDTSK